MWRSVPIFLWLGLLTSTAFAQWPRYIHAVKGGDDGTVDSRAARPLAYFTVDPRSRPDPDDLCMALDLCGNPRLEPSASELAERAKTHTDLPLLGKVRNTDDLRTRLLPRRERWRPGSWVNPGRDKSRPTSRNSPTAALRRRDLPFRTLGCRRAKNSQDEIRRRGTYAFVYEDYFTFSSNGAHLVNFKPVLKRLRK